MICRATRGNPGNDALYMRAGNGSRHHNTARFTRNVQVHIARDGGATRRNTHYPIWSAADVEKLPKGLRASDLVPEALTEHDFVGASWPLAEHTTLRG